MTVVFAVDPKWMLLDVRWDSTPIGCDRFRRPHNRTFLVEESATGTRMQVGRDCWKRLNEAHVHDLAEYRMSDCTFGCKVYRCDCGHERVIHMSAYGCPTR